MTTREAITHDQRMEKKKQTNLSKIFGLETDLVNDVTSIHTSGGSER